MILESNAVLVCKVSYQEHIKVHLNPYLGKTELCIKTVQENLGHATASFTLGTYAHITPGMKRESANRTNDYIRNLTLEK